MSNRERVLAELNNFHVSVERGFCRMVTALEREISDRNLDPSMALVFGSAADPARWERHFGDFLAGRRGKAPDIDLIFDSVDAAEPWGGILLFELPSRPPRKDVVSVDAFAITEEGVFDSSDGFSEAAEESVPRLAQEIRKQARSAEWLDDWLERKARPVCMVRG